MIEDTVLNIFQEKQPVTARLTIASDEEVQLHGVAKITELPFIQVEIPRLSIYHIDITDIQDKILIIYGAGLSILTLYTSVVSFVDPSTLLLNIQDYYLKEQERNALRAEANRAEVYYRPLDEQGNPVQDRLNSCEAVNLSKAGILIRMNEIIEPKQKLELLITLPNTSPFSCTGQVERIGLQKNGKMETAIQFENLDRSACDAIDSFCTHHGE